MASTKDIAGFTAYPTAADAAGDDQVEQATAKVVQNGGIEAWINVRGGAGTHHTRSYTFVFNVLRNGLSWCMLYTFPNL